MCSLLWCCKYYIGKKSIMQPDPKICGKSTFTQRNLHSAQVWRKPFLRCMNIFTELPYVIHSLPWNIRMRGWLPVFVQYQYQLSCHSTAEADKNVKYHNDTITFKLRNFCRHLIYECTVCACIHMQIPVGTNMHGQKVSACGCWKIYRLYSMCVKFFCPPL